MTDAKPAPQQAVPVSPMAAALTAFVSWYSAEGYGCDESQVRLMRLAFVAGYKAHAIAAAAALNANPPRETT